MDITIKLDRLYNQAIASSPQSFKRNFVLYVDIILNDKVLNLLIQEFVDDSKKKHLAKLNELKKLAEEDLQQTLDSTQETVRREKISNKNIIKGLTLSHNLLSGKVLTSADSLVAAKDELEDVLAELPSESITWQSANYKKYIAEKERLEVTQEFKVWFHWDNLLTLYKRLVKFPDKLNYKESDTQKYRDHLQAFHFSFVELVKEVNKRIRSQTIVNTSDYTSTIGKIIFYQNGNVIYISPKGHEYKGILTRDTNAYKLLKYLVQNPHQSFDADKLVEQINNPRQGSDSTPDRRIRDTIQEIREKLGIPGNEDIFHLGKGFELNCDSELKK